MGTEYDTLNHICATWGGLHGKAMAPAVTKRFAEEILKAQGGGPEDTSFAYLCLSQPGALPWEILVDYTGIFKPVIYANDVENSVGEDIRQDIENKKSLTEDVEMITSKLLSVKGIK